jgi:hypothetical protein
MRFFVLTPLTLKAKNKVHEAGSPARWVLHMLRDSVVFSDRPGPWLYLRPDTGGTDGRDHARWVHEHSDKDFQVKEV